MWLIAKIKKRELHLFKKELTEKFHCKVESLPIISNIDPMVKKLQAQPGDVIKITRKSSTAGISIYYRLVVVV